jgi:hypothetical protein
MLEPSNAKLVLSEALIEEIGKTIERSLDVSVKAENLRERARELRETSRLLRVRSSRIRFRLDLCPGLFD